MNTASSLPTAAERPRGSVSFISGRTSRTAFDTSSGLAVACLMMPTAIAGVPL
jgi:hypothetical protein